MRSTSPASPDDVQRVIGDIDSAIVERILLTGASADEIAEAVRELEDERGFGEVHHVGSSARVDEVRAILDDFYVLYGSGFHSSDTINGIDGSVTNGAAHVQYTAIAPTAAGVVRWTGLSLTTGVEVTRWSLGTGKTMGTTFSIDGHKLGYDMTGRFELASNSVAVPLEVSTGVRLAVISVYGGLGVDLTQGQGTLDAMVTGPLTDSDGRQLGTATISGYDSRGATPMSPHAFGGVQHEAWKLKVFGHVDAAADSATSLGVGVRGVL
jgi:hypothetical protein